MNTARRTQIFERLAAANPHPQTELAYTTPYQLLVAVVLSAQSTDRGVNEATARLFPVAGTPEKMLALGEEKLASYIRTVGLYPTKAKNVIGLSRILVDEHGGEVPESREALERLPGVGRKTANVILNTVFGWPVIAVDTHVFRVANRTRIAAGATPEEVEARLARLTPEQFRRHAHHWLILHGRYICQAKRPLCERCPIVDLCEYPQKTLVQAAVADTRRRRAATGAGAAGGAGAGRRRAAASAAAPPPARNARKRTRVE